MASSRASSSPHCCLLRSIKQLVLITRQTFHAGNRVLLLAADLNLLLSGSRIFRFASMQFILLEKTFVLLFFLVSTPLMPSSMNLAPLRNHLQPLSTSKPCIAKSGIIVVLSG